VSRFTDPGDQPRGRGRHSAPRAPEPASLFDISDQPPPPPFQVKSGTSIDAAAEQNEDTLTRRRNEVLKVIQAAGPAGIARFEVAKKLDVPDHWITSSVQANVPRCW
jgi:hypothetical protein